MYSKIGLFEIIPFASDHARSMEIDPGMSIDKESDIFDSWIDLRSLGGGFTAIGPCGMILCCGGITDVWEGHGDAWFLRSVYVRRFPVTTMRICMRFFGSRVVNRYRRIQCEVKAGASSDLRFASTLGFVQEGLMRKWGPDGSDYILMARVK